MLTLLVYEDGKLSIASDDQDAENIRVQDAFEEYGFLDLAEQWADVPFDGGMQMMVSPEDAKRALNALEEEFSSEVDQAYEERRQLGIDPPYVPGKPKPTK